MKIFTSQPILVLVILVIIIFYPVPNISAEKISDQSQLTSKNKLALRAQTDSSSLFKSANMLNVKGLPRYPKDIDWKSLPKLRSEKSVIFRGQKGKAAFNLHAYLAYYDRKFWAMWSSGLVDDDMPGQHVKYSTSTNGLD